MVGWPYVNKSNPTTVCCGNNYIEFPIDIQNASLLNDNPIYQLYSISNVVSEKNNIWPKNYVEWWWKYRFLVNNTTNFIEVHIRTCIQSANSS